MKLSVSRQGAHQGVRTPALDQSGIADLLDALRAGGDLDVMSSCASPNYGRLVLPNGGLGARHLHPQGRDLVKALGVEAGSSKSEVSRICGELDTEVAAFRSRSLAHTSFP